MPLKRCFPDIRKTFSLVQSQYPRSILAVISPNLLDLSTAVIESQYMDIFNQFRLDLSTSSVSNVIIQDLHYSLFW